ncbi:protein-glutamine gamma-glutamyltransferase [Paenibacillus sp. GCM10012307]|uniref:Protein-glutamine gamma-glutamyltransferase n=1 Tax=Paenibacillus roseus TaxID=2798579 RepID=A0A934J7J3_9BACL|nr:protein-glutamine gamma-glutamyltransferase [Paenibacillus roseus]
MAPPFRDVAEFEKLLRANIVKAAQDLYNSGVGFADFKNSRCNEKLWILTEQGGFQLRDSVTPAEGIRDIFRNGDQYAFECATATVIVLYKGVLDSIEESAFNGLFADMLLYDWHYDSDLHLMQEQGSDQALRGDVLYFANPDFDPSTPQWQGENVIKMGPDSYYGHGIGITSAEDIIRSLNHTRKPGSTRPAYLTNAFYHPDFEYLSQFAKGPLSPGSSRTNMQANAAVSAMRYGTDQKFGIQARIGQRRYMVT